MGVITYLFCRNLILLTASIHSTQSKKTMTASVRNFDVELMQTMEKSKSNTSTASTSLLLSRCRITEKKKIHLNDKQNRLISLTVRLIVLTVPAMISTSFVWIASLISWCLEYFGFEEMYKMVHWTLRVVIVPSDTILNFLCVYLAFDFVVQYYTLLCCVHKMCENVFKNEIKKQIECKYVRNKYSI